MNLVQVGRVHFCQPFFQFSSTPFDDAQAGWLCPRLSRRRPSNSAEAARSACGGGGGSCSPSCSGSVGRLAHSAASRAPSRMSAVLAPSLLPPRAISLALLEVRSGCVARDVGEPLLGGRVWPRCPLDMALPGARTDSNLRHKSARAKNGYAVSSLRMSKHHVRMYACACT